MKKYLTVGLMFLLPLIMLAEDKNYAVIWIKPELLKNANMVKRWEEESFQLKNPGEAIYRMKYALTILNENADRYAGFFQHYNKFFEIRHIEGTLYDAMGKELKKLKGKDIQDMSGVDDISLMDDTRYKAHNFYYKVYPYTVEYEVELKYNGTMFYPMWFPQERSMMSVEHSQFSFSCPENYEFRYKSYQLNAEPIIVKEKGVKSYTWKVEKLNALVRELYAPGLNRIAPLVLFGPTEFEMQNYKGNMKTWQDLGKFIYALKQGRDELPDDVKKAVHSIADGIADKKEKIRLLYEYLQKNTRYISIQLGIGGWQPFEAKYVAAKKYGDCKALSNYMYALLKEAGIPSNYTVIRAGEDEDEIFDDFPSSQFNHAILCVPMEKDTVWLECTDQYKASGYMGSFTGNRYALLVDENGGKLIRTPKYNMNENIQNRKVAATLEDNGTLVFKAATQYTGIQQDDLQFLLSRLSKDKVKERLHEQLDFATYDVADFSYKEQKKAIPVIDETLTINVSNYATITGKRLFIIPNVMTRSYRKPAQDTARKYDIVLDNEYRDVDSVEIELPKGYEPESIPQPVLINTKFGKYEAKVKLEGGKLFYYRNIEHNGGRFPAKEYNELVKFYEAMYKADRNRVVLVKKEEPLKAF
jgi:Domain of Unknown Function with PDB structure (DUF3857)/Transglutaminase-like superfamily